MMREIIVDNFAGGGGASEGIKLATGRDPDIAVNHDPNAIRMHKVNHPESKHYCEDVWMVDPEEAAAGRPVALAWFSPDCKHFSKAKGGKPKDKNIRGLAWVALRWAAKTKPRVIMLENVEEFKSWGPLNRSHRPIKIKEGITFNRFVQQLKALGYQVEYRELVAADYGAPTMRKRFFLIARRDGRPIVWPEITHASRDSIMVRMGMLKPYVSAADCIDFSRPCPSIFATKEEIKAMYGITAVRPLAEKTMNRIARGIKKFVLDNPEPFIVNVNHGGETDRTREIDEPFPTITAKNGFGVVTPYITAIGQTGFCKDRSNSVKKPLGTVVTKQEHCLIMPTLIQYHSETACKDVRGQCVDEPIMTVDGSNRYGLVTAFISKYFSGGYTGAGAFVSNPCPTVTGWDHNSIVTAYLMQQQGESTGMAAEKPIGTMTQVNHFAAVQAFLVKYYGEGTGQDIDEPLDTVTAKDRFGLVTVHGIKYQIVDIGLRMLDPDELYRAQGFPDTYVIDHDCDGMPISKSEQVKRCGNAVPPPFARALVEANLPELCQWEESDIAQ